MEKKKIRVVIYETTIVKNRFWDFLCLCDEEGWLVVDATECREGVMDISVVLREDELFHLGYTIGLLEADKG